MGLLLFCDFVTKVKNVKLKTCKIKYQKGARDKAVNNTHTKKKTKTN